MKKHDIKIECNTPTPGKKSKHILKWKYDIISNAILEILSNEGDGVLFKELSTLVSEKLDKNMKDKIGSIGWYTTTVKLDLECKNKILRVPSSSPQRLVKTK